MSFCIKYPTIEANSPCYSMRTFMGLDWKVIIAHTIYGCQRGLIGRFAIERPKKTEMIKGAGGPLEMAFKGEPHALPRHQRGCKLDSHTARLQYVTGLCFSAETRPPNSILSCRRIL